VARRRSPSIAPSSSAPVPEGGGQVAGVGGDDGVGSLNGPALDDEALAVHAGVEAVVAQAELVVAVAAVAGRVEQRPERDHERVGADPRVLGGRERRDAAPAAEREHDRLELPATRGERVDLGARGGRELVVLEDPGRLEVAQALREDVGAEVGQAGAQVGEALGAEQQLAHDEERPALADDVEGAGDATAIPVRALGHVIGKYY
jgi:hypothetical protein